MTDKKPMVHYLHVNKPKGCWTVHNSKGCFHFDEVNIEVDARTVYKPKKKDNPRFFIRCRGTLVWKDGKATIV
jgi:hypothetical protein